jgi:hypothetical protein
MYIHNQGFLALVFPDIFRRRHIPTLDTGDASAGALRYQLQINNNISSTTALLSKSSTPTHPLSSFPDTRTSSRLFSLLYGLGPFSSLA